jgi:hypothetical protein
MLVLLLGTSRDDDEEENEKENDPGRLRPASTTG